MKLFDCLVKIHRAVLPSVFCLSLVVGWINRTAVADDRPIERFRISAIKGATRETYLWEQRRLLFIGTVSSGTYLWRQDSPTPELLPGLKRTLSFLLWRNDLYIADEAGLFVWKNQEQAPTQILTQVCYRFVDGGDFLLLIADSGIYRVDGSPAPVRLAQGEQYFWSTAVWNGRTYYGNLNGLFVLDRPDPDLTPKRVNFPGKAIEALFTFSDRLLIQARDDQLYVLAKGAAEPKGTGIKLGFHRGQLEWRNRLVIWGDDGIYAYDKSDSLKRVAVADNTNPWGGVLVWGEDLVLGTSDGLLIWRANKDHPASIEEQLGRIENIGLWESTLLISETWNGKLWYWERNKPGPKLLPLTTGRVNQFIPWRGGLILADNDDGAFFFDPAKWRQGQIAVDSLVSYQPDQRIPVHWRIQDSPYADLPGVIEQSIEIVDAGGNLLRAHQVQPQDRKGNADFEVTIDPIETPGKYSIKVTATSFFGTDLHVDVPLQILGSGVETLGSLRDFFGWRQPKDLKDLSETIGLNLGLLGVIYFLGLVVVWLIYPRGFVTWHERLAARSLVFSDWFAKFSLPWLVGTARCLDATVALNISRALRFFNDHPEVKPRPIWVAAPLKIGDEQYLSYSRPPQIAADTPYIAGLYELRRAIPSGRFVLSVEGPGGVGKSTFAYQVARWAADGRLLPHRLLPIVVEDPSGGLDNAVRAQLPFTLNVSAVSENLGTALLRQQRVLILIDGASEKDFKPGDIRAEGGALHTAALVLTSRLPTNMPGAVRIQPQALTLAHLDSVLDAYIAGVVGAGRFSGDQREAIRSRLRDILKDLEIDTKGKAQVPMLILALLVQQAESLTQANPSDDLNSLPATFRAVVDGYLAFLLRDEPDLDASALAARTAAVVCLGEGFVPGARSLGSYTQAGIERAQLDRFLKVGLLARSGDTGDPFFKFALDPVAEHLAAREYLIRIRDGVTSFDQLRSKLSPVSATQQAHGFIDAFNLAALQSGFQLQLLGLSSMPDSGLPALSGR